LLSRSAENGDWYLSAAKVGASTLFVKYIGRIPAALLTLKRKNGANDPDRWALETFKLVAADLGIVDDRRIKLIHRAKDL
jgi:hypothetical protein